jgi:hypothetical protein
LLRFFNVKEKSEEKVEHIPIGRTNLRDREGMREKGGKEVKILVYSNEGNSL